MTKQFDDSFFRMLTRLPPSDKGYGVGRVYEVHIEAENEAGQTIKFTEKVYYPHKSKGPSGCTQECVREADGITQVKQKMPHLKNVRATGSLGI